MWAIGLFFFALSILEYMVGQLQVAQGGMTISAGGDVCSVQRREPWAGVLPGGDSPLIHHARQGRE